MTIFYSGNFEELGPWLVKKIPSFLVAVDIEEGFAIL